ncbi:hypothetical protein PMAYCL1PPCAC_28238, partial [Pristionchus mayeri]
DRVCVRCSGEERKRLAYRDRIELALHVQKMHPSTFSGLVHDYCISSGGQSIPDEEIHSILFPTIVTAAVSACALAAAAAFLAAAAAAALATSSAAAAFCSAEYWNGKPVQATCPRGCRFFGDSQGSRRAHYKRVSKHHYNVYYTMIRNLWSWTQLDRWVHIHLGE